MIQIDQKSTSGSSSTALVECGSPGPGQAMNLEVLSEAAAYLRWPVTDCIRNGDIFRKIMEYADALDVIADRRKVQVSESELCRFVPTRAADATLGDGRWYLWSRADGDAIVRAEVGRTSRASWRDRQGHAVPPPADDDVILPIASAGRAT